MPEGDVNSIVRVPFSDDATLIRSIALFEKNTGREHHDLTALKLAKIVVKLNENSEINVWPALAPYFMQVLFEVVWLDPEEEYVPEDMVFIEFGDGMIGKTHSGGFPELLDWAVKETLNVYIDEDDYILTGI